MSDENKPWRVFVISEDDWWLARSPEEAAKDYYGENWQKELDGEVDMMPRELTDEELEKLEFTDGEPGEENPPVRSFKAQLERRIEEGVTSPELFATTDCY